MFCPQCPKARSQVHIDFAAGHAVCHSCGLVVRNIVYEESGGDIVKTRSMMERLGVACSPNTSTVLGAPATMRANKKTNIVRIPKAMQKKQKAASKWILPAVDYVENCSSRVRVSSRTSARAKNIVEIYLGTAKGRRLVSKRNIETIGVAAVYIACREQKCARTVSEICTTMAVKEKAFRKEYKSIVKTLQLRVRTASPIEFLGRFCHVLEWRQHQVESRAQQYIENTPPDGAIAPAAVAAAALYLAATLNGNNRYISNKKTSRKGVKSEHTLKIERSFKSSSNNRKKIKVKVPMQVAVKVEVKTQIQVQVKTKVTDKSKKMKVKVKKMKKSSKPISTVSTKKIATLTTAASIFQARTATSLNKTASVSLSVFAQRLNVPMTQVNRAKDYICSFRKTHVKKDTRIDSTILRIMAEL
tara:strand:+ start:168 stop:1415 length:1248 start_codon:yes stop_codon:yes gene_type:complete